MENTVNQGQENVTENVDQEERTFTQAELDEIVKSRLAKERAKYTNYEELQKKASKFDEMEEVNKSELQKATEKAEALQKQIDLLNQEKEIRSIREKVSKDTGVPADLLLGVTEEDCIAQAQGILAYKNDTTGKYPNVKDGGEVQNHSSKTAEQQFADWFSQSLNN